MSKTIEITSQNFNEEVLQSKIPVLVDFWAPWCQPCLMMAPVLDELSEELKGKLKIGKLNTEILEHQSLAIQYQIQSIPNMKLFKNGKVVKEFIGLRPKEMIRQELEKEL
ncbi:MAG: thioredoxin [Candidatus Tagabacteria bacterium CG09_land_8_20_14_0_10_41_14]|uniref:Thioredoxin n=2 Tax=Candidatus Tagaibacteriota TaxID=1817918 RepID=A0A2H0WM30_9BACT|nr:MAG: thioredoxin [Candidatus Tagabacteria bacterium CG09_land_8_20_14_0_10_41_14]PJE72811.1 MAG: thioredoxin [Candidatus Tagabacteria bacterium CG10_big_fil_rev_8_21_14_0_10_40_13]